MGYIKIVIIGLLWLFTVLTSIKGWWKLLVLVAALLLRSERVSLYAKTIWESDDNDIYTLIGGKNPDNTISSHVGYRSEKLGESEYLQAEWLINLVFFWQVDSNGKRNHCRRSIEYDEVL